MLVGVCQPEHTALKVTETEALLTLEAGELKLRRSSVATWDTRSTWILLLCTSAGYLRTV